MKFLPRPIKDLGEYLRGRRDEATSGVVFHERAEKSAADVKVTPEVASPVDKTTPEVTSPLYVLIGLGISLPLLAVILPLLLSSDVIFLDFFEGMFDFGIEIDPGAVLFMMFAVFVVSY